MLGRVVSALTFCLSRPFKRKLEVFHAVRKDGFVLLGFVIIRMGCGVVVYWSRHRNPCFPTEKELTSMEPESKLGKNRRFKNRYGEHLLQHTHRFEGNLHLHGRDACSVIQRIRCDGRKYFKEDANLLANWERHCNVLWDFLNRELPRRKYEGQDLTTVLREFFQEFEHSSHRLDEMIYQVAFDCNDRNIIVNLWDWLSLAHRNSVYAIVAYWTPDRKQIDTCHMKINASKGTSTMEWTREEMEVPKKYKHATRRL